MTLIFFKLITPFWCPAHGQLEGPCVLQVQKVRNVSAPKDHEESQGAPRMLRLQMTDGHTTCVGLELKQLSKIRYLFNSCVAARIMLRENN